MHANTDEIIHLEKLKLNALKEAGNLIPNIKCIYCNLNLLKFLLSRLLLTTCSSVEINIYRKLILVF